MDRYVSLAVWAAVILAVYGLARPGSRAGKAVTSVTVAFSGVLNQGLTVIGG